MKNSIKLYGLKFVVLLLVVGCENASDTVVNIPSVQLGCTTTDSAQCSNGNFNGVQGFAIMTRSGCSAANYEPVATGSVVMTCDGDGCDGVISSWFSEANEPVTEILSGTMDICSTVDLDGTNSSDATSGDLVNDRTSVIDSAATITIDSWLEEP